MNCFLKFGAIGDYTYYPTEGNALFLFPVTCHLSPVPYCKHL